MQPQGLQNPIRRKTEPPGAGGGEQLAVKERRTLQTVRAPRPPKPLSWPLPLPRIPSFSPLFLSSSQLWLNSRRRASWAGDGAHGHVCALCRVHVRLRVRARVCLWAHRHVCVASTCLCAGGGGDLSCFLRRSVSRAPDKQPGSRAAAQSCWRRRAQRPGRSTAHGGREGGRRGRRAGGGRREKYLLQPLITEFEIPASRCHLFSEAVRAGFSI